MKKLKCYIGKVIRSRAADLLLTVLLLLFLGMGTAAGPKWNGDSAGLRFLSGISWDSVVTLAKTEHKYIFLDCYATWCAPCKRMERDVFSQKEVGDVYNSNFICVRMQMDRSPKDDERTKGVYADADRIGSKYQIQLYPTMLYFTTDGHLIKAVVGAVEADALLKTGASIAREVKDYESAVVRLKAGSADSSDLYYLAMTGPTVEDTVNASLAAKKYVALVNRTGSWTAANIPLLRQYTSSTDDPGFKIFYEQEDRVDKEMNDRTYSEGCVTGAIDKELATPVVERATVEHIEPDWNLLRARIESKYNLRYAERILNLERANWAGYHKRWGEWTKYYLLCQDVDWDRNTSGHWAAFKWNNDAWIVMTYSKDTAAWRHVLAWSARAVLIDPNAGWMDTYAILQYWLGEKELAIKWEETAVQVAPKEKEFAENLEKMKKGEVVGPAQQ